MGIRKIIFLPVVIFLGFILGISAVLTLNLKHYTSRWGLWARYYKGMNFERPISKGISKSIDYVNYYEMGRGLPAEHYSVRWRGLLLVPKDGNYTFSLVVDDGARLFIDGQLLIDEWHDNNSAEFAKAVYLKRGPHPIRLDYYQDLYSAVIKLYWAYEGQPKAIIAPHFLLTGNGN